MNCGSEKTLDKAFEAAVKYLAASPRSEKEVREKLYSKGFHRSEVDGAIEKAKGYRYIDDAQYVRSFIDSYGGRYGRKKIVYRLVTEKGIGRELADNTAQDMLSDEYEEEKAERIARQYVRNKKQDAALAKKTGAYLFQKGFDWNIIGRAVARVTECDIAEE